jgi:hypothetical protein
MKIGIVTKEKQYIFKTLLDTLGIFYEFIDEDSSDTYDLLISYGKTRGTRNSINIINSSCKEPSINWIKRADYTLPVFFSTSSNVHGQTIYHYSTNESAIVLLENGEAMQIVVGADIIASAHYLLSLSYEESEELKILCHERPIVTDYMFLLFELIKIFSKKLNLPVLHRWFWPKDEIFAVCLTHDIDIVKYWWLQSMLRAFEMLRSGEILKLCILSRKTLNSLIKGENPFLNFNRFVKLERACGFKSSFFFLTDGGSLRDVFRNYAATYSLSAVKKFIIKLKRMGWDVGLHGSFHSYNNFSKLRMEKKKLQEIIESPNFGMRQHFLKLDIPETWRIQEKCGFLFDCTLAHPSLPGFRGSFSFPFYPYDEANDRTLSILEIPLNIMDRTFTKYKRRANPVDVIEKFFHTVRKSTGLVTILWHNSSVDEGGFQGYFKTYKRILDLIKSNDGYGVSANELTEWWVRRRDLKLVNFESNAERTSWTFCSKWTIPYLTFKIYLPFKELQQTAVEGAENNIEYLNGLMTVKIQNISQNKLFSITIEK